MLPHLITDEKRAFPVSLASKVTHMTEENFPEVLKDCAGVIFSKHVFLNTRFQLSKAFEHLNLIFTVPESVKKTEALINEGKLLLAHKW